MANAGTSSYLPTPPRPWSRRRNIWEPPTLLDALLDSPLRMIIGMIHAILLALRGPSFKPPKNKPPVRIVCLSDTHTNTISVPAGDVLIHAGDLTNAGTADEIQKQLDWLAAQPHREKIVIAGNHDSYFDPLSRSQEDKNRNLDFKGIIHLQNKAVALRFRGGRVLHFYGAGDIPKCGGTDFAYQYDRGEHPWSGRVPAETDVLITHTPPRHHLDLSHGCLGLLEEIWRIKARLHVFGHVHSGHGRQYVFWDEGQRAYECLLEGKTQSGFFADFVPSMAWIDALKVIWYDIKGVLWQYLMVGPNRGDGGILINAAVVYRSTTQVGNVAEVIDI